jgi:hypothetical protein
MWDEGGSQGKGVHLASNDGVNKYLEKITNEEKDWGTAKTKSGTQTRSDGIPTLAQVYQKGKRAIESNQPTTSRRPCRDF